MENYKTLSEYKIRKCFKLYLEYLQKTVKDTELMPEFLSVEQIDSELDILYMKYNLSTFFSSSKNSAAVVCYNQMRQMINKYLDCYVVPSIITKAIEQDKSNPTPNVFIKSFVEEDYIVTKKAIPTLQNSISGSNSNISSSKSLSSLPNMPLSDSMDYAKSPFDILPPLSTKMNKLTKSISLVDSLNKTDDDDSLYNTDKPWSFFS